MTLSITDFRKLLCSTMDAMPVHADELRKLDAALGDGDLGITVSAGASAVADAVRALPEPATLTEVLGVAAKAFSTANPSTFAALVGGGLLAASKAVTDARAVGPGEALAIGDAAAARIAERGKAVLGDKTVLDALVPSLDTLRRTDSDASVALEAMIATAEERVETTKSLQSARGRAAWIQERSVGHADPGATAYLRFLQELARAIAN